MMKHRTSLLIIVFTLLALTLSACRVAFERNPDGSTRTEVSMNEAGIQTEIQQAIRDPQIDDVYVELHNGYIEVSGTRNNTRTGNLDSMSYRLDLGVADGHVTAVISQVVINGRSVKPNWVQPWNESIAVKLTAIGQETPNSTLETVTITENEVVMVWRVEQQNN